MSKIDSNKSLTSPQPANMTTEAVQQSNIRLQWAERIILRMSCIYGSRFTEMWRAVDPIEMKMLWAESIAEFTADEIAHGLQCCKSRDWPPTLPEFLKLCRPTTDPSTAFIEAQHGSWARSRGEFGQWSNAAIYWASVRFGAFDLMQTTYQASKARWESILASAIEQLRAGLLPPIPQPAVALPAPGSTRTSKEEGAKRIAEIAQRLASSKSMSRH